ncbi:MAG: hypothetical protein RQ899_09145 [Pseudomonadales bacterium]|nr:hypothetical protein [Pseudomonadales bacterium]
MSKKIELTKQAILPGFAAGTYEPRRLYDGSEIPKHLPVYNNGKRENRINIRVSAGDMADLQSRALAEGVPLQSLVAAIIRNYLNGSLKEVSDEDSGLDEAP